MSSISAAIPQFLVINLDNAIAFYVESLGFNCDFVYEGFYASVSRDGAAIHLKCAPQAEGENEHETSDENLDAFLPVTGIDELHAEFSGRNAKILKPITEQPWGARDFYVEDPDGHILCFSESA